MNIFKDLFKDFRICIKDTTPSVDKFEDIILMGPIGIGKSTTAELISKKLRIERCSFDREKWSCFSKMEEYDRNIEKEAYRNGGFEGLCRYWMPFEVKVVEMILQKNSGCIIDFGGTSFEGEAAEKVKNILEPYKNVILMLPSENIEESARFLRDRIYNTYKDREDDRKINGMCLLAEYYLVNPINMEMAKKVIYTKDKTPQEIVKEVLKATKERERVVSAKTSRSFEY